MYRHILRNRSVIEEILTTVDIIAAILCYNLDARFLMWAFIGKAVFDAGCSIHYAIKANK